MRTGAPQSTRHWSTWAVMALAPCLLIGCNEVSREDVSDARDAVREEQRETADARREATENIREQQRETAQARHEVMRPNIDQGDMENVREQQQDTQEARQEGREAVREEEKETEEARQVARDTEAKYNAQQNRDAYVKQVEAKLAEADKRIDQLKQQGESLEGTAKEENQKQVDLLQQRRDQVDDALSKVKSAETLQWKRTQDDVEQAVNSLMQAIDNAK